MDKIACLVVHKVVHKLVLEVVVAVVVAIVKEIVQGHVEENVAMAALEVVQVELSLFHIKIEDGSNKK